MDLITKISHGVSSIERASETRKNTVMKAYNGQVTDATKKTEQFRH